MKKRILLLLSLSILMSFGQNSILSAQCDIIIDMEDSYGDGWNGASIKVYDGTTLLGNATVSSGYSSSTTISAPEMAEISLKWTAGSYPEECGFTVTNGIGIEVYVCEFLESPDPGIFFSFINVCSSVGLDLNLIDFIIAPIVVEGNQEIVGVIRSERDTPITSFDAIYSVDGDYSEISTFSDLNIGFNESFQFTHAQLANIEVGDHEIILTIENINGQGNDDDPNNNILIAQVLCVNEIFAKNVVYEEATGTWCGWCPRGLVGLNTMAHDYTDGSWIGIGVHGGNDPMKNVEYSLGLGITSFPSGLMNRENVFDPGLSTLEPAYLAAKQEIPLAKIEVTGKTWDEDTRELTVETSSNFAMDLTATSVNLTMVIVESGLTGTTSQWNQSNSYSGGGYGNLIDWDGTNWADLPNPVPAADMVYQHVGRTLVGGWDGVAGIIPADVTYGTTYIHEFEYTVDDGFNPAEVDLVVMLIDATTGIIANAYQISLEGDILAANFSADVVSGLAPLEVNFTDETQGGTVATWSWDFDNDGIEDSNEQNPTYIFEDGGNYSVKLTVTNRTDDSFTTVKEDFINIQYVGIGTTTANTFKYYPNPVKDVLNVESVNDLNNIRIFNVSGQIVYSNSNMGTKLQTIDISSFDKGVYFMKLGTELETKTVKIVVN